MEPGARGFRGRETAAWGGASAMTKVAMDTIMNARPQVTIAATVTLVLSAACASAPEQTAKHREARIYQTGTAIPMRDRSGVANVRSVDPESLHQELNGATRPMPIGSEGR
jgi:hypothetical protein